MNQCAQKQWPKVVVQTGLKKPPKPQLSRRFPGLLLPPMVQEDAGASGFADSGQVFLPLKVLHFMPEDFGGTGRMEQGVGFGSVLSPAQRWERLLWALGNVATWLPVVW